MPLLLITINCWLLLQHINLFAHLLLQNYNNKLNNKLILLFICKTIVKNGSFKSY